ncbi:hypothetical protein [Lysobacter gummosus]|uniref:hypothetical protein n=1 Tax=Lysobacter gummosus TaxID=262324 RepID=UPI00362F4138
MPIVRPRSVCKLGAAVMTPGRDQAAGALGAPVHDPIAGGTRSLIVYCGSTSTTAT